MVKPDYRWGGVEKPRPADTGNEVIGRRVIYIAFIFALALMWVLYLTKAWDPDAWVPTMLLVIGGLVIFKD